MKNKGVTAWSYSRLSAYEVCPRAFFYRYVEKRPEPPSEAMKRGLAVHETLEDFVKATRAPRLPNFLSHLRPQLMRYRAGVAYPELELAFDADWQRVDWFDRTVRLRVKIDLSTQLAERRFAVIDYKTGEPKPERHQDQLSLYVLGQYYADARPGAIRVVETGLWYVDHHPEPLMTAYHECSVSAIDGLRRRWEARARPLLSDRVFKPSPKPWACKRCAFSKFRGGPCDAAAA